MFRGFCEELCGPFFYIVDGIGGGVFTNFFLICQSGRADSLLIVFAVWDLKLDDVVIAA